MIHDLSFPPAANHEPAAPALAGLHHHIARTLRVSAYHLPWEIVQQLRAGGQAAEPDATLHFQSAGFRVFEFDDLNWRVDVTEGNIAAAPRQIIAEVCKLNHFKSPKSDAADSQDAASLLTAKENAEACAEGWSLFTHCGELVELRLERIDHPDEGDSALPDDAAAWHRVWTRATPLHLKVIDILRTSSPSEYARIEAYVHGLEAGHAQD